jgi:hypothetical protein
MPAVTSKSGQIDVDPAGKCCKQIPPNVVAGAPPTRVVHELSEYTLTDPPITVYSDTGRAVDVGGRVPVGAGSTLAPPHTVLACPAAQQVRLMIATVPAIAGSSQTLMMPEVSL